YTPDAVVERYGFGPEFVADYKALVGDTSDNIPGVPGIGAKSATELILQLGHIEEMLSRFDEIPAKYQKKIAGNEEQMKKSKWLATIHRDVKLDYDFKPLSIDQEGMDRAMAMFESLEFKNAMKRAPKIFGPYLSDDGVTFGNVAVVEVETEKLEVKASDLSSY